MSESAAPFPLSLFHHPLLHIPYPSSQTRPNRALSLIPNSLSLIPYVSFPLFLTPYSLSHPLSLFAIHYPLSYFPYPFFRFPFPLSLIANPFSQIPHHISPNPFPLSYPLSHFDYSLFPITYPSSLITYSVYLIIKDTTKQI